VSSLQHELNNAKQGILLLVKWLNIDELSLLLLDDITAIVSKFYLMIEHACQSVSKHVIVKTQDPTKLYVVVQDNSRKAAEQLAYSIYSEIQSYLDIDFPESYLKCSVGSISFSKSIKINARDLVSMILYGMSISNGNYYCYDDNPIDIDKLRRNNINLNLFRASLLQNKAKFVYQPVIDRTSGNIEYYECLLRIQDVDNNLVSVGSIIEDAETKGLVGIVDSTVIAMVINELENDKNIKLSVNLSNIGVRNKQLLNRIENLFKKFDVAKRLIVEITETSFNLDFNTTKNFIDTLHQYGCKIALDDFGSGFTSFKQLLNLPIDIIKIDGSYIRNILSNNHSRFFVEALVNLAKDLGIKTVAEFVDNAEIAKLLIDIKIGGMQGNFFLPASESRLD